MDEVARLQARLRAWEERNGKLYENRKFNDSEEMEKEKTRIYSEHIAEYKEIKSRLEELQPTPIRKDFSDKHPLLYLLGFGLCIVGFFIALNLIVQEETPPPRLSDSELQERCIKSIPLDYPQTMYDNAIETCMTLGMND